MERHSQLLFYAFMLMVGGRGKQTERREVVSYANAHN